MKIQINEHVRFFVKDLNTGKVKPVVIGDSLNPEYEFWIEIDQMVDVTTNDDDQIVMQPTSEASP